MKKLTFIMALIFLTLTQIAWSPVDSAWSNTDLNDGHGTRHEIFLNSESILGGRTYSLFIDPTHVDFVHWYSNNASPIPSTLDHHDHNQLVILKLQFRLIVILQMLIIMDL
jgi:hypothetical protein